MRTRNQVAVLNSTRRPQYAFESDKSDDVANAQGRGSREGARMRRLVVARAAMT